MCFCFHLARRSSSSQKPGKTAEWKMSSGIKENGTRPLASSIQKSTRLLPDRGSTAHQHLHTHRIYLTGLG